MTAWVVSGRGLSVVADDLASEGVLVEVPAVLVRSKKP